MSYLFQHVLLLAVHDNPADIDHLMDLWLGIVQIGIGVCEEEGGSGHELLTTFVNPKIALTAAPGYFPPCLFFKNSSSPLKMIPAAFFRIRIAARLFALSTIVILSE